MSENGYFQVEDRSIYCSIHTPAQTPKLVAVLCEPFGEEKRCAYRMLVRLAEQLAGKGIATLRMDVSGTGESSGSFEKASWNQWQAETMAAMDFARQATGAAKAAAVGFRAGALLASHAASKGKCDLVSFVEPILSGEELLTDLERRQKIKDMMNAKAGAAPATLPEGFHDFGAFLVSPAMSAEIRQASLPMELGEIPGTVPLQLLHVTAGKTFPPAWQTLAERAGNQALIIHDKPFWGQVDYFESDAVLDPIGEFLSTSVN